MGLGLMVAAILWFIGCIEVVGVVLVVVVALVYQILVSIVFKKNLIYKKKTYLGLKMLCNASQAPLFSNFSPAAHVIAICRFSCAQLLLLLLMVHGGGHSLSLQL